MASLTVSLLLTTLIVMKVASTNPNIIFVLRFQCYLSVKL
jgi:hypothetical protein